MEYPIQENLVISIKDSFDGEEVVTVTITVEPLCAYDVLNLSNMFKDDGKLLSWLGKFVNKNVNVIYHKPSNRFKLYLYYMCIPLYMFIYKQRVYSRMRLGSNDIAKHIFDKVFKKHTSIFKDIAYPKVKGQKGNGRNTTFLESLVLISKEMSCDTKYLLKNYTMYEIMALMDAMQLINNEKVEEYRSVNKQALVSIETVVSNSNDIRSAIKDFKEKRKRLKEQKDLSNK